MTTFRMKELQFYFQDPIDLILVPKDDGIEKYLRPSVLKHFTKPVVGNAGDVFLFFKQTWHGRIKSDKAISSDSIIMGIYPVGYEFKPFNIEKKL